MNDSAAEVWIETAFGYLFNLFTGELVIDDVDDDDDGGEP